MKKICIIFNPKAGNSKLAKLNKIIAELNKNNAVTLFETSVAGDATNIARTESANFDIIVAAGGDGTINEVASCLVNTQIKLGIITIGSGNGLASNLSIPKSLEKATEIIRKGKTQFIDVGKVNDKYFVKVTYTKDFRVPIDEISKIKHKHNNIENGYEFFLSFLSVLLNASTFIFFMLVVISQEERKPKDPFYLFRYLSKVFY